MDLLPVVVLEEILEGFSVQCDATQTSRLIRKSFIDQRSDDGLDDRVRIVEVVADEITVLSA